MTGIERLREFAAGISPFTTVCGVTTTSYDRGHVEVVGARLLDFLSDIADQIERERVSRMRVLSVVTEMEHHILGHEGMEDSPVARWARELREALGGDGRDPAADVSMSAYDLLPADERDAIAWVRDHGGLDGVKRLLDWVVGHCSTKQQLDFDFWLSGRVMHELGFEEDMADRDEVEGRLLARLMPEGMSWPVFEDGEPVQIGDVVSDVEVRSVVFRDGGILLSDCTSVPGWGTWRSYKEPIKRPSKVLDADGAEIRVGDTVYYVDGREQRVNTVARLTDGGCVQFGTINEAGYVTYCEAACIQPNLLTHRAPVLAADGRPLREGETVWSTDSGTRYTVEKVTDELIPIKCCSEMGSTVSLHPSQLTHERPVADTWERLEEDAGKNPCDYFGFDGEETCGKCPASGKNCEQTMARDLVRRARALAERERGE